MQACYTTTGIQSPTNKSTHILSLTEKYITINAQIDYQTDANNYKCNVKLRIQRDSLIWFSAMNSWGMEIMRGRITPLGIEVLNHLEKFYQMYDYPSLQIRWKIPCSYSLIEMILLGQLANMEVDSHILQLGKYILIQQQQEFFNCLATIHRDTRKLASLSITDTLNQHTCCVFYEYKRTCKQKFLFCDAKAYFAKSKLSLQYKTVTLSKQPLCFSFNIPQQYDKL